MEHDEYISNIVFNCNSINPEHISKYTEILIRDIKKRTFSDNNSLSDLNELFWYLTKIPFYCLTKIINASLYKHDPSIHAIISFMQTLYTSTNLPERIKALFTVFDYDNDLIIHIEDIKFFMRNYYIIKYSNNCNNTQLELLDKIISNISEREIFTLDIFTQTLLNKNGDIFYLFFLLSSKDNLFHKNYIDLFIQNNTNTNNFNYNEQIDKNISLSKPSSLLIQFIDNEIYTFNNFEKPFNNNDNDFNELDDFETSVSSCISNMGEPILKPISYPTNSLLTNNKNANLTHLHFHKKFLSFNNIKRHFNNSSNQLISLKYKSKGISIGKEKKENETIHNEDLPNIFDIENNYAECSLLKYGKAGIFITAKVIIKDKLLFLLSKCKTKDSYKIDSIYILTSYYPSYDGCVSKSESSKLYHKLILRSNINHQFRALHFFSADKNKIINIIDIINNNLNFVDVRSVYTFQTDINRGSFGTIYLCKHNVTNQTFAIKQIAKTIPNQAAIWEENIFFILKAQPCQFIIKSYEIFESFSNIYLVYEYYPFGNLRFFLLKKEQNAHNNTHTNDKKTNASFIYQQFLAIEHLNKYGIVHRDIKPDNLMLNVEGNRYVVKLIDFGLSKIISPNEKTNEPFGSLVYSAPEVISSVPYNYSPDIWSIGMVIYFLIYEIDPFSDLNLDKDDVQELICNGNVEAIFNNKMNYDVFLSNIMKKCLLMKQRIKIYEIKKLFKEYFCSSN